MADFRARYEGTRCGLCGDEIQVDDLARYVDDELCHAACADEEEEARYGD